MPFTPAVTGTYNFNPSMGDLTIQAFQMCGVRPVALTQEHMQTAVMAANLMQSTWSGQGVNLWQVSLSTVPLVQGTATYTLPSNIVSLLDLYITVGSGSTATNRYILPVSRSEYASYANPTSQGFPTTYWFNRQLTPTVSFWPVPDGNEVSFSYYACQNIQDASLGSGALADIPYYFQEAYVLGLAARLSLIWAQDKPQLVAGLAQMADKAFQVAASQNVETANLYISPSLQSYWKI